MRFQVRGFWLLVFCVVVLCVCCVDQPRDQPGKCLYYAAFILVVSLNPLQIEKREFGVCFYVRILGTQQRPLCNLGGE